MLNKTHSLIPYKGTASFIEAITILSKYIPSNVGSIFHAEHDIILSEVSRNNVSSEDTSRLNELGWHIDSEFGEFCWDRIGII